MNASNKLVRPLFVGLIAIASMSAQAGGSIGTINYSPYSTPIPTLSGAALIGLSLLLATIAYRTMRSSGSHFSAVITALMISGLGTLGGFKLVSESQASPESACEFPAYLQDSMGGQKYVHGNCVGKDVGVINTSGAPLKIDSIIPLSGYQVTASSLSPGCALNNLIPANSLINCYIKIIQTGCM